MQNEKRIYVIPPTALDAISKALSQGCDVTIRTTAEGGVKVLANKPEIIYK